ncbi:phosphatidylserine decarboxylase [Ectothiorhodospiraceae bacterium WFHF3C12]|nr:phosphatidylserine decarboxylase [Ectothiorhodospiraceae bacterium WFHF3C12]
MWLTRRRWAAFKNLSIRWFIHQYGVDMTEAADPRPGSYATFNDFFTRALRRNARPLPADPAAVLSPSDGTLSHHGEIRDGTLIQAKSRSYGLEELLGGDAGLAREFQNGHYLTVYLSPSDYHRVHMPATGELLSMTHVPGRLFSVAPFTVRTVPRLFARNERVVARFSTRHGPMALILVGAIGVGSIETVWHGVVTPPRGRRLRRWQYADRAPVALARGVEMGRFNMGSTVIALFGPGQIAWSQRLHPGLKLRLGETVASYVDDVAGRTGTGAH